MGGGGEEMLWKCLILLYVMKQTEVLLAGNNCSES